MKLRKLIIGSLITSFLASCSAEQPYRTAVYNGLGTAFETGMNGYIQSKYAGGGETGEPVMGWQKGWIGSYEECEVKKGEEPLTYSISIKLEDGEFEQNLLNLFMAYNKSDNSLRTIGGFKLEYGKFSMLSAEDANEYIVAAIGDR